MRATKPELFAFLDRAMWQAYYKHDFLKLFILLIRLCNTFCKPNAVLTIRTAYHSARAAVIFRKTKGHEDSAAVLRHLTSFYTLLANHNINRFDPAKAAHAELEWWLVDRYPERYEKSRALALAEGMSAIYNVPATKLKLYGQKREAAMLLIDRYHHDVTYTPDWDKIESLLNEAYAALHIAVKP